MTGWGYDYRSPSLLRRDLEDRSDELISAGPSEFEDRLNQMLAYETAAATASLDCGMPPAPASQPDIYRIVLTDLAHRFLQDNPEFSKP